MDWATGTCSWRRDFRTILESEKGKLRLVLPRLWLTSPGRTTGWSWRRGSRTTSGWARGCPTTSGSGRGPDTSPGSSAGGVCPTTSGSADKKIIFAFSRSDALLSLRRRSLLYGLTQGTVHDILCLYLRYMWNCEICRKYVHNLFFYIQLAWETGCEWKGSYAMCFGEPL